MSNAAISKSAPLSARRRCSLSLHNECVRGRRRQFDWLSSIRITGGLMSGLVPGFIWSSFKQLEDGESDTGHKRVQFEFFFYDISGESRRDIQLQLSFLLTMEEDEWTGFQSRPNLEVESVERAQTAAVLSSPSPGYKSCHRFSDSSLSSRSQT